MSGYVVLKLLNELGEEIKCEACRAFYHFFPKKFNKFNNTGAQVVDSMHSTLKSQIFA